MPITPLLHHFLAGGEVARAPLQFHPRIRLPHSSYGITFSTWSGCVVLTVKLRMQPARKVM